MHSIEEIYSELAAHPEFVAGNYLSRRHLSEAGHDPHKLDLRGSSIATGAMREMIADMHDTVDTCIEQWEGEYLKDGSDIPDAERRDLGTREQNLDAIWQELTSHPDFVLGAALSADDIDDPDHPGVEWAADRGAEALSRIMWEAVENREDEIAEDEEE